jgi:Chloroplast envelope transporter
MDHETLAAKKKSLIRNLLKKEPDKSVVEELGKLLVGYPDMKVPLKDLASATARLKVDLRRSFGKELKKFYRRFLEKCLDDQVLSSEDWKALHQLKILFGFSDAQVERIHNEMVMRHYRKTVEQALTDKKIDSRERSFLKKLQQNLQLLPEVAEQIYRDQAAELVQRTIVTALSDERLSPREEEELESLAHQLGVRIDYDEKTKNMLDRYRLFWLIENGEIPAIDSAIKLGRNEKCFFTADAYWCELESITRTARYGRLDRRADDEGDQVQRQIVHELNVKDSGRIYLTNKRILFSGDKRQRSIPLSRIKDFVPMENGIQIHRMSGNNPFLRFELGVDVFSLILARMLRDHH